MKNIVMTLLSVVLVCGVAAAQQPAGQETKKEMKSEAKPMKKEKKPRLNKLMGTVEAVDAAAGKVTVKDHKGMSTVVTVGADVKIMKAGKAAALADIMVGEKIHVMYEGELADPSVKEIKIMPKEGMKKEKKEKTEKKAEPKSGV